jgi:hypothetical protein
VLQWLPTSDHHRITTRSPPTPLHEISLLSHQLQDRPLIGYAE